MKLDEKAISAIERDTGSISLYRLHKESQYMYARIRKFYSDLVVYYDVPLMNGGQRSMPFLPRVCLSQVKVDRRINPNKKHRTLMGRPYSFCLDCENKDFCSLDIPCSKRDEYIANKKKCSDAKGDDRFWNNGKPKKCFILCQYFKTRGNGECKGSACQFYNGECTLFVDKKK